MPRVTDGYRRFLCRCFAADRPAALEIVRTPHWRWEELFATAIDEDVLPALAEAVRAGLDISASPEVSDFLAAVLTLNRERNRQILDELHTVVSLLNGIGIEPILLKGAAYLTGGVYQDPATRYLLDLDLLLPATSLDLAFEHLGRQGYSYDRSDHFGYFRHHYPPLCRQSVEVELHGTLGLGPCRTILPPEAVIERAESVELAGLRARLPSPTHLIVHLIMHSQVQHPYYERIWPPLRAMLDLIRIASHYGRAIDWQEVESRFERAGRRDLLLLHLADVQDALGHVFPLDCSFGPVAHLRSFRRRLLREFSGLRHLDPIYLFSMACTRRLRVINNVLRAPAGWKHLFRQLAVPGVYHRLFLDVTGGRGR